MQRRMTSGCSSQRSFGSKKKEMPRDLVAWEWLEQERARTVWPWEMRVLARNWP